MGTLKEQFKDELLSWSGAEQIDIERAVNTLIQAVKERDAYVIGDMDDHIHREQRKRAEETL